MAKITMSADCGNAPKGILLRDFNVAVARGDLATVAQSVADDVVWHLYEPSGHKQIHGKASVLKEYAAKLRIKPKEFVMATVITHGNTGAVNGSIESKDDRSYVFCDVYKFSSHAKDAKIKDITSYIIENQ